MSDDRTGLCQTRDSLIVDCEDIMSKVKTLEMVYSTNSSTMGKGKRSKRPKNVSTSEEELDEASIPHFSSFPLDFSIMYCRVSGMTGCVLFHLMTSI